MIGLEHGGRLSAAVREFGLPEDEWLDLSTGINPLSYPLGAVPAACWQRLPDSGERLLAAAREHYACESLLAVAGSQAAIQALPRLCPQSKVGVLHPSYAEHGWRWQQAGHSVQTLTVDEVWAAVDSLDVLVLVNPNNPTGHLWTVEQLQDLAHRLARRGGWLIVDEAFMDVTPQASVVGFAGQWPNLIVLRSLGKFFGLAGARVGFVAAWDDLLQRLAQWLGPWTVTGPAEWAASQALADSQWQEQNRRFLLQASQRLVLLLTEMNLTPDGGSALFQWIRLDQSEAWYQALARRAILVRRFAEPAALRFGLPADEVQWQRLATALRQAHEEITCAC